jgi:antimicrobial peptide system SdpA family protein
VPALIVVSAISVSPASFNILTKAKIMSYFPEGWGGVSRNPREEDLLIYEKQNGIWQPNRHAPIAHYRNYFGMSKLPRARSIEAGRMASYFSGATRTPCDSTWQVCLESPVDSVLDYAIRYPYRVFPDTICLVRQEPLPWAWARDARGKISMPLSYLMVKIE